MGQEGGEERVQGDQDGGVRRGGAVDPGDDADVEDRGAQQAEQGDQAPVAATECGPEGPSRPRRGRQDGGGDRAAERGERERRKEGLGRLDRGVAASPEQDDDQQDEDDRGVGGPASRKPIAVDQRFFMSSGKFEENECDFTTPWVLKVTSSCFDRSPSLPEPFFQ